MLELWKGLLFGLILSLLIGPVFFALLQTSIEKGFKAGFFMAIGISLSDALYIIITYSGISQVSQNDLMKFILGIVGSIIMIGFGVSNIVKPVPNRGLKAFDSEKNNYFKKIVKGFILNGVNPFVLVFWLGVASLVNVEMHYSFDQAGIFYFAVVSMVFSTDIAKAFLAYKLRLIITPRFMKIMNRLVGILLILFGARLFYFSLMLKQII